MIEWPNANCKKVIKQAIAKEYGFQDTIGIIDGIHIVLDSKPNRQGEGYFNRKRCCSIQCKIVNDDKCCILYILASFTSASHDIQVFLHSDIWLKHSNYFFGYEYLLVDIGYSFTKIIMAPYKKPAAYNTTNN